MHAVRASHAAETMAPWLFGRLLLGVFALAPFTARAFVQHAPRVQGACTARARTTLRMMTDEVCPGMSGIVAKRSAVTYFVGDG